MRRNLRNWDTQGWQIQIAATKYPIGKKKCRIGYRLSKYTRLGDQYDKKFLLLNKERTRSYPIGRQIHLSKQLDRLEYYIGLSDMGGGDG